MGAPDEVLPAVAERFRESEEMDPVDALLVMTEAPAPRAMDFVRAKFGKIKQENNELKDRVRDLEHTLSIVQTAQQWSLANGMSAQQAQKVREVTQLLQQAKQAKEEAANFSRIGRPALYEKLRACKNQLKRERDNVREMRERLVNAFDHARVLKEQHQAMVNQQQGEREGWQALIDDLQERHREEVQRLQQTLQGAGVSAAAGQQISSEFRERGQEDLSAMQQHLNSVKEEAFPDPMAAETFQNRLVLEGEGREEPIISLSDDEGEK